MSGEAGKPLSAASPQIPVRARKISFPISFSFRSTLAPPACEGSRHGALMVRCPHPNDYQAGWSSEQPGERASSSRVPPKKAPNEPEPPSWKRVKALSTLIPCRRRGRTVSNRGGSDRTPIPRTTRIRRGWSCPNSLPFLEHRRELVTQPRRQTFTTPSGIRTQNGVIWRRSRAAKDMPAGG